MMTKLRLGQLSLALVSFCICISASAVPITFTHTHSFSSTEDVVDSADRTNNLDAHRKGKVYYLSKLYVQASKYDDFDHVARTHDYEFSLPAGYVVGSLLSDDLDIGSSRSNHDYKKPDYDDDVAVQEPASIALLGLGLVLLGSIGRLVNIAPRR